MTVSELIEKLQEMPQNLEVRFPKPNGYGGLEPQKVWNARIERDDPQDDQSQQIVVLS
jgi:hypothetical protein